MLNPIENVFLLLKTRVKALRLEAIVNKRTVNQATLIEKAAR